MTGSRLAVRATHGDQLEFFCGVPVKLCGEQTHRGAGIRHDDLRNLCFQLAFADDCRAPVRFQIGEAGMAVKRRAFQTDKQAVLPHQFTVDLQIRNFRLRVSYRRFFRQHADQVIQFHAIHPSTGFIFFAWIIFSNISLPYGAATVLP